MIDGICTNRAPRLLSASQGRAAFNLINSLVQYIILSRFIQVPSSVPGCFTGLVGMFNPPCFAQLRVSAFALGNRAGEIEMDTCRETGF